MDAAFTDTSKFGGVINLVRGLIGAALGGVAGYFLEGWLVQQNLAAPMLPGALLGLGCGLFIRKRSLPLAIFCGILALALGVFTEGQHLPFVRDQSFDYFIRHLFDLRPIKLLLLALGGFCGFWFALGTGAKAAR